MTHATAAAMDGHALVVCADDALPPGEAEALAGRLGPSGTCWTSESVPACLAQCAERWDDLLDPASEACRPAALRPGDRQPGIALIRPAPRRSMALSTLHIHLRDALGVAPGDLVSPGQPVPAPTWAKPIARLAWERMASWARTLDDTTTERTLDLVPVWWSVAEDAPDDAWEAGFLAVDADGLVAFVRQPTTPLPHAQTVAVRVRQIAWVVTAVPGSGEPLARQMGPYGVRARIADVTVVDAAEPGPPASEDTPTITLEPWTQVVRLRVPGDASSLAHPGHVRSAAHELSDLDP